jgi:hypothetical protein
MTVCLKAIIRAAYTLVRRQGRKILMDKTKRAQLISSAKALGYSMGGARVLVNRSQFFDGNDDLGSIGCNLPEHPGIAAFDDAFHEIENMEGVAGVYFAITEIDESYDDIWPFTDTAWIVTRLSPSAFEDALQPLEPDEFGVSDESFANPPTVPEGYRLVQVWWD